MGAHFRSRMPYLSYGIVKVAKKTISTTPVVMI